MTLESAIEYLLRLPAEVSDCLQDGLNNALEAAEEIAIEETSGPYRQAELTAMGHPYAKRYGPQGKPPPLPAGIANLQTPGTGLAASWETAAAMMGGDTLDAILYNTSYHGRFFDESIYPHGTYKMIARPLQRRIAERLEPLFLKDLETALSKHF